MNVRDVSDEILSGWICKKLEPMPLHQDTLWHIETRRYDSRAGYWTLHRHSGKPIEDSESWYWTSRNMVNDPAMTVMLLGKMTEPQLWDERTSEERGRGDPIYWGCTANMADEFGAVFSENLGRAVAEAFALANGWTE